VPNANHRQPPPRWRPQRRWPRTRIPAPLASWLLDTDSLTARIRQACPGCFRVRVLGQGWATPRLDEQRALGMRAGERALVREVQLLCDGRPWVFARTIIPANTLRGPQRRLAHLGERPLGAFLFADPRMRRGPVELACIRRNEQMYDTAVSGLRGRPACIWGRRSVFRVGGKPLLVSEVFLPGISGQG